MLGLRRLGPPTSRISGAFGRPVTTIHKATSENLVVSESRQHAQNPRQEGGPDNEVARQGCIESEKYQGDRGPMVIRPKPLG